MGSCPGLGFPLEACGCYSQLHMQTWERDNFCNEFSTPAAGVLPDKPVEQLSVPPTDPPNWQGLSPGGGN